MKPRISIITPSFNQGKFIRRTIESVLSQDVEGLEYLVIDGGSTDETFGILQEYGSRFYWVSEKDEGHTDAINKGILKSAAPVIGWLNSDDVYYPHALKTVLSVFDSCPDVDVLYGDAQHIDGNSKVLEPYPTEEWNMERLKETCYICQPAAFIRRSVVERFGLLDATRRFCMDYDYWIRLGKEGAKFMHLEKLLAGSRLHPEASTVARRVLCSRDANECTRNHFGKTPDRWIFNYAHALAEDKGFLRSNKLSFALAVSFFSYGASLRWNRSVSRNILKTTAGWIRGNLSLTARELFKS